MNLAISIRSEYVMRIFGIPITNTILTSILVTVILGIIAVSFSREVDRPKSLVSRGLTSLLSEWLARVDAVTHDRAMSKRIFSLTATFFLFIFAANVLALVPGFLGSFYVATRNARIPLLRSPNTDLSTTLALAIISVLATQYYSFKALGMKNYFGRFINLKSPLTAIIGFFELLSEVTRLVSFSFRLFGNMFAGEVLLLICAFILPFVIPLPFMVLELFVGFIQAFIFATLTLSFIALATRQAEVTTGKEVSA